MSTGSLSASKQDGLLAHVSACRPPSHGVRSCDDDGSLILCSLAKNRPACRRSGYDESSSSREQTRLSVTSAGREPTVEEEQEEEEEEDHDEADEDADAEEEEGDDEREASLSTPIIDVIEHIDHVPYEEITESFRRDINRMMKYDTLVNSVNSAVTERQSDFAPSHVSMRQRPTRPPLPASQKSPGTRIVDVSAVTESPFRYASTAVSRLTDKDMDKLREFVRMERGLPLTKAEKRKPVQFRKEPAVRPKMNRATAIRTQHIRKCSLSWSSKTSFDSLLSSREEEMMKRLKKLVSRYKTTSDQPLYKYNRGFEMRYLSNKGNPLMPSSFRNSYEAYNKPLFTMPRRLSLPKRHLWPPYRKNQISYLGFRIDEDMVPPQFQKKQIVKQRVSRKLARPPVRKTQRVLRFQPTPRPKSQKAPWNYECCKFHDHWVGNWYQSGIRKTISIQGNRFSSKGSCVASDGDKFLIADDERTCYRCVVIHEKHYNVLQYKETFCHGRETLNKICALITGEALLYSMFRENATPITCPFKPPYTFTYNRGHGDCRSPVSTIDSCTQDSKFVIQYQACPDVYGSESALEEIQCLAVWKEGSYRYLVGKVNNYHIASGEDHYRCFVFEKSSTFPSISMDTDSTVDREVEYKIAQSGDATCTGLFSPAEGSRTMILKRTPHNFKCKFPNWMTKKKQWHTLDYSYSYTFWPNNNTLSVANTTSLMDESYYLNEKGTRHSLFNGEEIRINCVDSIKSTSDYIQLLTHYLTECQRGYLCITLHKRSDHIAEVQLGAATRRQEDACQRNFFDPSKTPYITLVTPEPETKVCPFYGNFRVNGVSGMEQSVSDRFSTDESHNSQTHVSSVDIMETFSDNLSQNYLRADSQARMAKDSNSDSANSQLYSHNSKYTRRRNVKRRDINYVGFQSNAKLNLSTTHVLTSSGSSLPVATLPATGATLAHRGHDRAHGRSNRWPEVAENGTTRSKRDARSSSDKKNSCILNFNKLYFGCRSPDTMEFRSDCPLFSSDIISVYLCHGSWIHNVSQNLSVHYLVTTPLSRTSRGVRRYCFMYQTNEDSSLIHFTSTSDTCHRDSILGTDGALSFNITPTGGAGKCVELNSTSTQSSLSYLAVTTILLFHYVFTISSSFSIIR